MTSVVSMRFAYGDHPSQFGVLRVPQLPGRHPVVVAIHGGFWLSRYGLEENDALAEDLTRRGYATWNIEYRRTGEDGGGWPGTFHDVVAAVNHLRHVEERYPLDLSRVVVLGHSAGGHLALWLAARSHTGQADNLGEPPLVAIRGVISLAGVTDLRRMWEIHTEKGINSPVVTFMGGTPEQVPQRYHQGSPIELLPLNVQQVLIHGEDDRHVPVELSIEYHRMAVQKGDKVRLEVLPGVEHFQVINPSSTAWKTVIGALEALLPV